MTHLHFKLNRTVKIDGKDFAAGIYPVEKIAVGYHSSIIKAGWGEYCGELFETVEPDVKPAEVKLTFAQLVSALLVAEHGRTKAEADGMVKKHVDLMVKGIMSANIIATAMALEIQESKMSNLARVFKMPESSKFRDKFTGQEFTGKEIQEMCPWMDAEELQAFLERFETHYE